MQSSDGAFCAWREGDGTLAFEYPEITGYALTWLAAQPDLSSGGRKAGMRAANWLLERLQANAISAHADWDGGAIYTFDLGMIAAGLISFGRCVGEPRLQEQGESVALHLASLFLETELPPAIDPSGPPGGREITWSNASHPHLSKCVQSLLLAEQWEAGQRLVDHAAGFQRPDGYYLTQPREDLVMLHPHFYTVEAMWMWGTARQDRSALDSARRATEWAWAHQLPAGGMPRLVNLGESAESGVEQLDVTSQAIRAALLLGADVPGLARAVERLCAVAHKLDGGAALPYQPGSSETHLNAWVSMFGAQALQLAAQGEGYTLDWHELV
ncbi:MAG TPA: hypothetical protein VIJ39_09250 [Solirubrobacteraceae bacterium]